MSIEKKITAKKKLFEVLKKLNKVNISERFNLTTDVYAILMTSLETLKNGELLTKRGGNNKSTTQFSDDLLYVNIEGNDSQNNEFRFNFEVSYEELDSGVTQVTNVDIKDFYFASSDEEEVLSLSENELIQFNKQKNVDFYDIITNYVDIDFDDEISMEGK